MSLTVATAASSNHFGALRYLLASLRGSGARVECYDIGLTDREVRALPRGDGLFYHKFDFAAHPPHMNTAVNAGEYAWKPVIVADVIARLRAEGSRDDVVWADAGTYFEAVAPIAERIRASGGLWLRPSSGKMRQWTHPLMFARFGVDAADYGDRPNADATLVGFAVGSGSDDTRARLDREIVRPWTACAMDRDCIAPKGSSRRNHRQDQAALSLLAHRAGYAFSRDSHQALRVRCKCDRWFYQYIGFHVPAPVYARCCLY